MVAPIDWNSPDYMSEAIILAYQDTILRVGYSNSLEPTFIFSLHLVQD